MLNVRLTSAGRWNISASFLAAYTLRPFLSPNWTPKGGHRYFRVGLYIYIYIEFYWRLEAIRSGQMEKHDLSRSFRWYESSVTLICYGHRCRAGTRGPDVCGSWWKFFCRDINFVCGGTRVIVSCVRDGKFKVYLLLVRFFLDVHVVRTYTLLVLYYCFEECESRDWNLVLDCSIVKLDVK